MNILNFFSALIFSLLLLNSCKNKTSDCIRIKDINKERLMIINNCFKYQKFDINLEKFSFGGFSSTIENNSDKVLKIRFIDEIYKFDNCSNHENMYLQVVKVNNLSVEYFNNDDHLILKPKDFFKVDFKFVYLYIDSKQNFEDFLNSFFSEKCNIRSVKVPLLIDNNLDTLKISLNKKNLFCEVNN